jgi:hypothetical protein
MWPWTWRPVTGLYMATMACRVVKAAVTTTLNGHNARYASNLDTPQTSVGTIYNEEYVSDQRHTAAAATSSYTTDTNWYADSGATDQITSELDKLAVRDKYLMRLRRLGVCSSDSEGERIEKRIARDMANTQMNASRHGEHETPP